MNAIIEQLKQHRSIRRFKPDPIGEEQLLAIVQSAQAASTSSNVQAYSVIAVTDREKKRSLARYAANQAYIEECPVFLVWCADLNRIHYAASLVEESRVPNSTEIFIIATVDTALAAQNAAIAAESLGMGIVYIGGIRDNPADVSRLLELPKYVYPVFGMCVGYPDQDPTSRPRLPVETVLHRERYTSDSFAEGIERYNGELRQYTLTRAGGNRDTTYSKEMANRLRVRKRDHMRAFLREKGFDLE
ncbi:oxygen-insensitive NADPH nitroreductase [Paenibacillus mesophilus]|uniref:oxygen-insensitive NADPH nitroreductase n=1 Tax=Paenibacillus mesophilus TaxID=2582849 RepID=UPI00110D689F|nr:oxygen-insensitive NADPH nitroreductase [Paenibacillus mesophilus]TMV43819.1 oxygen-insensitive NADPH nitroreductase [Paenibacillus mesophilus]